MTTGYAPDRLLQSNVPETVSRKHCHWGKESERNSNTEDPTEQSNNQRIDQTTQKSVGSSVMQQRWNQHCSQITTPRHNGEAKV
jgi:hypothetical protein